MKGRKVAVKEIGWRCFFKSDLRRPDWVYSGRGQRRPGPEVQDPSSPGGTRGQIDGAVPIWENTQADFFDRNLSPLSVLGRADGVSGKRKLVPESTVNSTGARNRLKEISRSNTRAFKIGF